MGVWMTADGKLSIEPQVDDYIIQEFIRFSEETCPPAYYREKFYNPWFFDEQNRLACHEGKFGEASIWYRHLKENFFELRGFVIKGEPHFLGEFENGYTEACEKIKKDLEKWWKRRIEIKSNEELFLEHQKKVFDKL